MDTVLEIKIAGLRLRVDAFQPASLPVFTERFKTSLSSLIYAAPKVNKKKLL